MTHEEYQGWYADLAVRVPSLWQWVEGLPQTADTLRAWFGDVFEQLELRDCMAVTYQLVMGDLQKPFGSDIPSFFRREGRRIAWERKQRQETHEADKRASRGAWDIVTKGSMGAAFRKNCEIRQRLKAEGMAPAEIDHVVKTDLRDEWVSLL